MKTIFVVNAKAGKGNKTEKLKRAVDDVSKKLNLESMIYFTEAVGDACRFVREYCRENGAARFIACGGDGTLSEVLNGAMGCADAEVGVIPIGTGNDFCKNFNEDCDFFDVSLQMTGESIKCDAIKYTTEINNIKKTGYGVNMFNIGFDCNVADATNTIKRNTILSGSFAYLVSIFLNLVKKKGADLEIEIDEKLVHSGKLLLTSVANGSYCGGGIMSNPNASVNDGFININIIKNVSRLRFISLLPSYMKGTFLSVSGVEKIAISEKCKKVGIKPKKEMFRLCNDGEIIDAGKTEFEIIHNAFNFVMPTIRKKDERLPSTDKVGFLPSQDGFN